MKYLFYKTFKGCCFVVVVVSEFILRRNQRALLRVGKKDVSHFNKSNVKLLLKKQRRKGKIQASECRVPKNSKKREESLQRSVRRNRGREQNGKD